jgi:hypothetical protein
MMDERRRQRRHEQRAAGPFDAALKALLTDPVLATRASVALAVPLAAGAVGGLALLLLAGLTSGATLGGCLIAVGGVLGLALALLALGLRRDRAEQTRAPWRINVALGTVALAVVAFAMRAMPMSLPFALALGVVVALLAIGCGLWTGVRVEREIRALARERRAAWHAQIRASRLTRRMLGYRAYRQLRRDGALPVESTIHPARILVMDGDRPIGGLCSRPRQPLPDPEEALTHILAIRTDERAWLARANFFPQDRALTPQARGLAPGRPGNYER